MKVRSQVPCLLAVVLLVASCSIFDPVPDLEANVFSTDSYSSTGVFGVGVKLENLGSGRAVALEYDLVLTGSLGYSISYSVNPIYTTLIRTVDARGVEYSSIIGVADVYIPYGYAVSIKWQDDKGRSYGPAGISGYFSIHP